MGFCWQTLARRVVSACPQNRCHHGRAPGKARIHEDPLSWLRPAGKGVEVVMMLCTGIAVGIFLPSILWFLYLVASAPEGEEIDGVGFVRK